MYSLNINIFGLRKSGLIEGLDHDDVAIIEYVKKFYLSGRGYRHNDMVWIDYKTLMHQNPLLGFNSKSSISRRMKMLEEKGLLYSCQDSERRKYFKVSQAYIDAVDFNVIPDERYNRNGEIIPSKPKNRKGNSEKLQTVSREVQDSEKPHQQTTSAVPSKMEQDAKENKVLFHESNESFHERNAPVASAQHKYIDKQHNYRYINNKHYDHADSANANHHDLDRGQISNNEKSAINGDDSDLVAENANTENRNEAGDSENNEQSTTAADKNDPRTVVDQDYSKPCVGINDPIVEFYAHMGIELDAITSFIQHRRNMKAPMTPSQFITVMEEALKCSVHGFTVAEALDYAQLSGWLKIKPDWLERNACR